MKMHETIWVKLSHHSDFVLRFNVVTWAFVLWFGSFALLAGGSDF